MKLIRWIQGWLETWAIMRDKELFRAVKESKDNPGKTEPWEDVKARLGVE